MDAPLSRRSVLAVGAGFAALGAGHVPDRAAEPARGGRYHWDRVAVGGGGAVPGMVAHPRVPDLFYIRTDVGTPYRWDSGKERWIPLLEWVSIDEWWRSAAESICVDPSEPDGETVYVAVGKYDWAGPGDVWKSSNRGRTWRRTGLPVRMRSNGSQLYDGRLAVDPQNGKVVYYASELDGLWRTVDGAKAGSWRNISPRNGRFVAFDPTSARTSHPRRTSVVYVGTETGVVRSTDGGETWGEIGGPADPRRAIVDRDGKLYVTHAVGVGAWDGSRWTDRSPTPESYGALAVDPSDPRHILVSRHEWAHNLDMYRSTDGGRSWQKLDMVKRERLAWAPSWHFASSTFSLTFNPADPAEIWFTDWYYAWRTRDITAQPVEWENRYEGHEEVVTVGPLVGSVLPDIVLHSAVADVGGFEHHSLTAPPSTHAWNNGLPLGTTSTGVAFQESDPRFVVRVGGQDWNGPGRGGYSTDGGATWTPFAAVPGARGRVAVTAQTGRLIWATQGGPVYVSEDRGASWSTADGVSNVVGGDNIFVYTQPLAADPVDDAVAYIYKEGVVYRTDDGGHSWDPTGADGLPSVGTTGFVTVATVPGSAGEVWLATEGHGLWRSTDRASSFTKIEAVTSARLFCVGVPGRTGHPTLFVFGTVDGVSGIFRSEDTGQIWRRIDVPSKAIGDEPNVMGADRKVFGRVFVGTNGNGIYYGEPRYSGQ